MTPVLRAPRQGSDSESVFRFPRRSSDYVDLLPEFKFDGSPDHWETICLCSLFTRPPGFNDRLPRVLGPCHRPCHPVRTITLFHLRTFITRPWAHYGISRDSPNGSKGMVPSTALSTVCHDALSYSTARKLRAGHAVSPHRHQDTLF